MNYLFSFIFYIFIINHCFYVFGLNCNDSNITKKSCQKLSNCIWIEKDEWYPMCVLKNSIGPIGEKKKTKHSI